MAANGSDLYYILLNLDFKKLLWLAFYLWLTIDVYYGCCEVNFLADAGIPCSEYPFDEHMREENETSTGLPLPEDCKL
jgi:hypothetical protein